MFRGRGEGEGSHEHSRLPRRPARHRDHRRRCGDQRARTRRQAYRGRQNRLFRGGRGGARLPQLAGFARRPAREHFCLRHRWRRLSGTRRTDGSLEGGLCAEDQRPQARRRDRRRRHLSRPLRRRRPHARARQENGDRPADHGARQSQSRDHARTRASRAAGRDDLHRALRLPQPGQQRPVLPLYFPRRARCRRERDQRGDEARRRQGDRGAGARSALGSRRARLWRRGGAVRARFADPEPIRSAPDHAHRARGRAGGDGPAASRAARSSISALTPTACRASSSAPG